MIFSNLKTLGSGDEYPLFLVYFVPTGIEIFAIWWFCLRGTQL